MGPKIPIISPSLWESVQDKFNYDNEFDILYTLKNPDWFHFVCVIWDKFFNSKAKEFTVMKPTLKYYLLLLLLLSQLVLLSASPECPRFSCGGVSDLGFPFSNTSNPACGLAFMNCTGDAPLIQFSENGKWYLVDYINGLDRTVVICDLDVQSHLESNQCGLLHNFTEKVSPFLDVNLTGIRPLFKCNRAPPYPISSSFFKSFRNHSCKDYDLYYYGDRQKHLPALPQNLSSSCSVVYTSRLYDASGRTDNHTLIIGSDFSLKLQVHRRCWECHSKGGQCLGSSDQTFECANLKGASVRRKVIIGISAGFGCVVVTALLFILWKRPHYSSNSIILWERQNKTQRMVEDFLRNDGALFPKRYNYYDLKKITSSFTNKIGQGSYGEVYKGKLFDGRLVAVKLLNDAKGAGGQEFINEVASISKTSHVNVVSLLGFCFDGSKRALIYEYMANGSLEKFIYDRPLKAQPHLGWDTLYQIAVGVARGLEYLHRGCNTCILHFDIKPHNILLDLDFTPKISDFGLAKLCPRNESIISMLDARGTAGYIAPEVFNRQFGGVSHKSDVYSYGMMVLDIVAKRENIDISINRSSEIYFPNWIHKRLKLNEDLGLNGIMSAEERDKVKKMTLIALWCIQLNHMDRPTMTKVVEMLEATHELLSIPPNPYLYSPPRSPGSPVSSPST